MDDLLTVLTETTCGYPCWMAREDVCRCSCGGKNHGCLKAEGGVQPQRMAKIDGFRYRLEGVGHRNDLWKEATKINHPSRVGHKTEDKVYGYKCPWTETDKGAPARLKYPSRQQFAKWPELAAYRDLPTYKRMYISMLWVREDIKNEET